MSNSATKFAWGLRLGANIWASEKMAIKLQGQLMSAVQGAGGGLYFGTGGGRSWRQHIFFYVYNLALVVV